MNMVDEVTAGDAQLLDVRDDSEWEEGHALGAIHITAGGVLEGEIDPLKTNKPVYVYCESGDRASMAESYLNENGFDALNIGGLEDWIAAGGQVG
jgi:rhodanese-related sulfurtransferase